MSRLTAFIVWLAIAAIAIGVSVALSNTDDLVVVGLLLVAYGLYLMWASTPGEDD